MFVSLALGEEHELIPIPDSVFRLPEREGSAALFDMIFKASELPPLSLKSYYISRISEDFTPIEPTADTAIGNDVSFICGIGLNKMLFCPS